MRYMVYESLIFFMRLLLVHGPEIFNNEEVENQWQHFKQDCERPIYYQREKRNSLHTLCFFLNQHSFQGIVLFQNPQKQ